VPIQSGQARDSSAALTPNREKGTTLVPPAQRQISPSLRPLEPVSAALGGMLAIAAALGIGRFVYTPILPPMVEALGLSRSEAGLLASANFLGYLVGALLAALPRRAGARRLWLLRALALSATTTAAMGLTETSAAFVALRFVGGATSALVLIFSSTIVLERLADANREGLSALHFAGVGAGIVVSAALVAALLHLGQSWRSLWFASGGLTLLTLPAVAVLLPDVVAPKTESSGLTTGVADAGLLRLVIAYGLFGFGYVVTATFLVAIVRATPTVRALEPVIWVVFGAAAVPSVALWTRIATPIGILPTFAAACIVEAAGVLASAVWPSALGLFLAAILVGGTFMGLTALGLLGARARAAGDPRRVVALMTGAFGLGQIIGPLFAGIVSDQLGGFTAPSIVAALALGVAAVLAVA
jgi:predicted MFS family arabinose efflux permease